jgi:hypothetical protein
MITPLLKSALEPVVARHRRLRSLYARAICWWLGSSVVAVLLLNGSSRFHALLAALATMAVARIASGRLVRGWSPDYRQIARAIEDRHPELHALLRTAVEQQPDPHTGQLHFLQQRVISEAVAQSRQHQWLDSIPTPRWIAAGAAYALGLAAMAATFFFRHAAGHGSARGA